MEKIHEIKDQLPNLKAIIQTLPPYADYVRQENGYWKWSDLQDLDTSDVEQEYENRLKNIKSNECCSLVYTSGTTGE
jgi:long-chain-fatty-acid--CoA ligase ACSBG